MTSTLDQASAILKAAEEIVALKAIAGPGDLSTAQIKPNSEGDWVECPACNGEGMVDAETYVNFDDKPLTVQFYGIGECFGNYQNLFDAAIKHAPSIASALIEKHRALEEAKAAFQRIFEVAADEGIDNGRVRITVGMLADAFLSLHGDAAAAYKEKESQ